METLGNLTPATAAVRLVDMPKEQVGETVDRLADLLDLNSQQLATKAGTSRQVIHTKRTGQSAVKVGDLWPLAHALGVPMDVLFMLPDDAEEWLTENQAARLNGGKLSPLSPCSSVDIATIPTFEPQFLDAAA